MRFSVRRPRTVLALWVLAVLVCGVLLLRLSGDAFGTAIQRDDGSDSARAQALLREHFPQRSTLTQPGEVVVVRSDRLTVDDPAYATHVQALAERLMGLGEGVVLGGTSYFLGGDASLVSADRRTTLVPLVVADPERNVERLRRAVREAAAASPLELAMVGPASIGLDYKELAEADLRAELRIGLPVAIAVLLGAFATVVAALVPVLVAFASVAVALGVTVIAAQHAPVYFLVTNMVVMMGLAVGIDYSLFMLSRYREERRAGHDVADAVQRTASTAGHAIAYSGMTVVVALVGLLMVPTNVFRSLALGAILVVLVSVLASFTLLPALVRLLGDRLEALRVPLPRLRRARAGLGLTRFAMRRPWTGLVLTTALLLALAAPALQMRIGFAGVETLPERLETRQAFRVLQESFRLGQIAEALVVIDGDPRAPGLDAAIARLRTALAGDPAFIAEKLSDRLDPPGSLRVLSIPMPGDAESAGAHAGIARLRAQHLPLAFEGVPVTPRVGGGPAGQVDFFRMTETYTPWVVATVLALSFALLALAFRSIVVPITAILLNLLSVGAAYGVMVRVFQQGVGTSLFGFARAETIEAWIPLFLFTVLYGLSMDYHVFLLSRIRERFLASGDNADALAHGVSSTAGVITGAALIMVAIFAGFAAGELAMFQQVGFGLAVAVLLDATVVRLALLPAAMTLLGDWNWYVPRRRARRG